MQAKIGIKSEHLIKIVQVLCVFLADEFVLSLKTRKAHWNIEGPDFHDKHHFFEEQFQEMDIIVDNVAEHIRSLGHYAPASLNTYLQLTHLNEQPLTANDSNAFVKELLADHESIIIHFRENIERFAVEFHDTGSSDLITGLMGTHGKMAWMLRSQLK